MGLGWMLLALGFAALAFGFIFGGREERIFVLVLATSSFTERNAVHIGHDLLRAALVDLAVLAIVLPLALRTTRTWPLLVASLCVAGLMTEAAQVLVHAAPKAYAITQGGWDLLADLVVAAGAWNVQQARQPPAPDAKTPDPG